MVRHGDPVVEVTGDELPPAAAGRLGLIRDRRVPGQIQRGHRNGFDDQRLNSKRGR
jgi:hypothetical protein